MTDTLTLKEVELDYEADEGIYICVFLYVYVHTTTNIL